MNANEVAVVVRDGVTRGVAVVGLAGVALIHLLDLPGKFEETPYMGWMYIGLILSCVAVGGALIWAPSRAVWSAGLGLMLAVITGFVLSRTTGLPNATGDIGNWGEPLGMASLFVEGSLVALMSFARANAPKTAAALRRRPLPAGA